MSAVKLPRLSLLLAVCALSLLPAIPFALDPAGLGSRLEWALYDLRMAASAPQAPPDDDILIVDISQTSLDHYVKTDPNLRWPWPYMFHGHIVRAARAGGARAVLFDVSFEGASMRAEDDEELLRAAIEEHGGVALAVIRKEFDPAGDEGLEPIAPFLVPLVSEGFEPPLPTANRFAPINPELAGAARALGDVVFGNDADGILRSYPLLTRTPRGHLPSLALAGLLVAEGARELRWTPDGRLVAGSRSVAADADGSLRLRYYGRQRTFRHLPADHAVAAGLDLARGRPPSIDLSIFRGRIVLVGATAPALFDFTSVPTARTFPGVEVHATALANMMHGHRIARAPALTLAAILFFACAAPLLFVHRRPTWIAAAFAIVLALWIGAIFFAFARGVWIHAAAPSAVLAGALVASLGANYLTEGRQRRLVKSIFEKYVSPRVVERLVEHPELVRLGGERRTLTCFFLDLEGFTGMSEALPPERVVETANRYLNAATLEIWKTEGTVDKYVADAIVAFWGAPEPLPDHARRACEAAWRVRQAVAEVAAVDEREGRKPLRARIGLNTGEVVVGNVGAERQFNYTVMGDEVNLASRLEGANKLFGTGIILSERTIREAGEGIVAREVGSVRVLGRQRAIRVYELLGLAGEAPAEVVEAVRLRAQAMEAFLKGDWDRAEELFECSRLPGRMEDRLTDLSKQWCRELKASGVSDGAGHVIRLESK
jgi:adenylate cyclase